MATSKVMTRAFPWLVPAWSRSMLVAVTLVAGAGLGGAVLVGCGSDETSPEDLAEAKKLLKDARADDYEAFLRAPGWEQPHRPGPTPRHGAFVDLYANNVLQYAIGAGPPYPEGTLLIEEGYDDAEATQLQRITILHKNSDGNWFAAEYDAHDKVLAAGIDVDECNGCHDDGEDYVLGF